MRWWLVTPRLCLLSPEPRCNTSTALPSEVVATLPAMPGVDRDWADEVLALATSPAPKLLTLANEAMDERLREIAEEEKGQE